MKRQQLSARFVLGGSLLAACLAASLCLAPAAMGQPYINDGIDTSWLKCDQYPGNNQLGDGDPNPYPPTCDDWSTDVWDGPADSPGGYVAAFYGIEEPTTLFGPGGDVYAVWDYPTGSGEEWNQWFKTSLYCYQEPDSVTLVRKYQYLDPDGNRVNNDHIPINDDLFVWVNGQADAGAGVGTAYLPISADWYDAGGHWETPILGGTSSLCINRVPNIGFGCQPGGGGPETASISIYNGLPLDPLKFQAGANEIALLTDDIYAGGAMGHVLFDVSPPEACAAVWCEGFEPPLDEAISVRKNNRVLPFRMVIYDGWGNELTDMDIAPPVLELDYDSSSSGTDWTESSLDAGLGDDGNQFVYRDGKWHFHLKLNKDYAPGAYVAYAKGGADGLMMGYSCKVTFEVN